MGNWSSFEDESYLDREDRRADPEAWSGSFPKGVVASAHYRASAAGAEVFHRGGNAIDAAVAASFALGVCESAGSGIGGMSMMMVHLANEKRTFIIEGACRAPRGATPEAVAASHRYRGYRAVAVPMNVAVLRHALLNYGNLSPASVLEPAIRLAEEGFPVSKLQSRNFEQYADALRGRSGGRFFLDSSNQPLPAQTRFRQPTLGKTLRRLQTAGFEDFYTGEIARKITDDMESNGGFIDEADLEKAISPRELLPLQIETDLGKTLVAGPPAGGMSLVQLLQIESALGQIDPDDPIGLVRMARAIQVSRRDRQKYRLKTGSLALEEAEKLLTGESVRRSVKRVLKMDQTRDSGETSHISAMDSHGNAVALTQSIERCFGSAEAAPDLGFLYNGYLRAFKVQNKKHPHYLRPENVARSNAAPTIVLDSNGWAKIAIGSTGSERMISGIFGVLLRLRTSTPFEAVAAPRLHCPPEGAILWEGNRFPNACRSALQRSGFALDDLSAYSFKMGGLQLAVRSASGQLIGVADPRRDGAAAGA